MTGSFTISRCLWDDAAFQDEPFSEREAWVWMIAEARWKPQEKRVGSAVVSLERGQLAHSTRFLSEAWKWSHAKVRRFLERLENRHMIQRETGTGVSVITICKYNEYQLSPDHVGTAAAHKPAQQRHSSGTNLNKGNKGNKENNTPLTPPRGAGKDEFSLSGYRQRRPTKADEYKANMEQAMEILRMKREAGNAG